MAAPVIHIGDDCCCPDGSGSGSGSGGPIGDGCVECFDCCTYTLSPPDELYFTWGDLDCVTIPPADTLPCDLANGSPSTEIYFTYQGVSGSEYGWLREDGAVGGAITCEVGGDGLVHLVFHAPGWSDNPANYLHYAIAIEDWKCTECNTFYLVEIPIAVSPYNEYATELTVCWRAG